MDFKTIVSSTVLGAVILGLPMAAWADQLGTTKVTMQKTKSNNFVLFADEVDRNDANNTVTARGNVQIVNEPYILLADEVTYSQTQDLMTARGHVRLMQQPQPQVGPDGKVITIGPDGKAIDNKPTEVLFGDYMELTSDTDNGKIINARMLFSDDSRLVARNGNRYPDKNGEPITVLHDALYSPCELCKEDPTRAPLWQMHSSTFVHDTAAQEMRYYNATMDIYGVPVFYTPYFDHPDPTVKQAAGLLAPMYLTSPYLGSLFRTYYYYPISPTQDTTTELSESTAQGPLLGEEWREQFKNAMLDFKGAFTDSSLETNTRTFDTTRGYIEGTGEWDINPLWRAGTNIEYASDQTFLEQYKYDDTQILTNRLYAERFEGRSYGVINAYAFQDLRPNNPGDQPNLLPYMTYSDYGKPGGMLGGRWGIEGNFLGVDRPYGGEGMQRLSGNMNWQRDWFMPIGLKNTLTAQVREDVYQVQNADPTLVAANYAGQSYGTQRFIPSANWQTSMPFVKTGKYVQYELEPLVAFTAIPRIKNAAIPNEDSQDIELDATNLFDLSRYPGIDRVEDGERATYGVRDGFTNRDGGYFYTFIGQSDRINGSNDLPVGSGLSSQSSDIVGQVTAAPSKFMDVDYRIRADHNSLAAERHELSFDAGPDWLRFSSNYAYLRDITEIVEPVGTAPPPHQQIANGVTVTLTKFWKLSLNDTEDLDHKPEPLSNGISLQYLDECFFISANLEQTYTQSIGVPSGESFYVTFGFKNLGDYNTPTFNSLSASGSTTP